MKKLMIMAVMMTIAISATATTKNSWPTTSKLPTWPVMEGKLPKLPAEPKLPKLPSWPVGSWPAC